MEKVLPMALVALLALFLVSSLVSVEVSAAPSSSSSVLCNMTQDELTACKPACSTGMRAAATPPTDACCSALGHANLTCLCGYKNSSLLPYLGIDPKLAVQLPAKCNVPAPAQC